VVSSAGNEGNSSWHYVTAPCDADSILCVGAVSFQGDRATFSSVGPTSDGRIKPDVMARGLGTALIGTNGSVTFGSGTSFSAPLVAGMAACLMEAHPQRSNMEVIQSIRESGDRFATPDTAYGYGVPNACVADSLLSILDSLATFSELFAQPDRYFAFYPNPVTDQLVVEMKQFDWVPESMEVFAADGTLVQARDTDPAAQRWSLDTGALSPGIYMLKLHFFGNRSLSHKFVKQ